jgi:predicted ArsR family transcriptional regulator
MNATEKRRKWKAKQAVGRERALGQTQALELLAERETVTLYELADLLRISRAHAHTTLTRLQEQKLAVCIEIGRNGNHPKPSVWQLRETFERMRASQNETSPSAGEKE